MKTFNGKAIYNPSGKAGFRREDLPVNCVGRYYNMFNDK
jgi:hypothetical protein